MILRPVFLFSPILLNLYEILELAAMPFFVLLFPLFSFLLVRLLSLLRKYSANHASHGKITAGVSVKLLDSILSVMLSFFLSLSTVKVKVVKRRRDTAEKELAKWAS